MDRLYFFRVMTLLAALWSIAPAHADWMVQDTSQIGFVSIKNNSIGENNAFQRVSGSISEAGMVAVAIDLTSVETGVGIRNERLQTMLFDVASFPSATVKATLSPAQVMALRGGGTVTESVALDVSLYGTTVSKTAELLVSVLDDNVRVTSTQPIMITALDFGLESGVAALQKIAGLSAISRSIPITVDLRLKAN